MALLASTCLQDARREAVRTARKGDGNPFLNGIDFVEVSPTDQTKLTVNFIHNIPGAASGAVPSSPVLTKTNFTISGGVRITGIKVVSAASLSDNQIAIQVDQAGDFSQYTINLMTAADNTATPDGFDPQLAGIAFSFKVNCPSPFDCAPDRSCPPMPLEQIAINYLAKDYASFRTVILDRMSLLAPNWRERNPADAGIALVELLAYAGDYLSYQQDSTATEAYLGTARRRTSVRRHARLVDYRLNDGSNARVWIQISVANDTLGLTGKLQFLTRVIGEPLRLSAADPVVKQALSTTSTVFESLGPLPNLYALHNRIPFYTWSASDYCLPVGATTVSLAGDYPHLNPGDVLIFAEALGPDTGDPSDADPSKRQAVRLIQVDHGITDPLTSEPLTRITWHAEDALQFSLCLSWHTDSDHGSQAITNVSIASGNILLSDHGRTIGPPVEDSALESAGAAPDRAFPRFRPGLAVAPLTFAAAAPFAGETSATLRSAASAMRWTSSQVAPAVLQLTGTSNGSSSPWNYAAGILTEVLDPNEQVFTIETENDGSAFLRFGDNDHGARPDPGTSFQAAYRVGNGTPGNVAAGSIAHVLGGSLNITAITNPLPATGGVDPESLEHVRLSAPFAFRTQERAVTDADYAAIAERYPGVQKAAATFRWTGSWYTVFISIDRLGGLPLDAPFKAGLAQFMELYRMAAQDIEIEAAVAVPLSISMHVCLYPDYFQSDVRSALLAIFNSRIQSDGTAGLFYPDNFTLGGRFYLSSLYAAAQSVDGVESVRFTKFERRDNPGGGGLTTGYLDANRIELFTLDNNPNFPERGTFDIALDGGR